MKIVSIMGSPSGMNGYTGSILNSLLQGAINFGAETENFILSDLTVNYCKGCCLCSKNGHCAINDDYETIKKTLTEADGIIFATPNYVFNVSGQMKVFLDRSFSMFHTQMLKGKYAASVIMSGGPGFEMAEKYLSDIMKNMGLWNTGNISVTKPQMDYEDERKEVLKSANDLGRRIAEAISDKKTFPDQEKGLKDMFEMMKLLVPSKKEEWAFEYEYWKSRWGLDD